MKGAAKNVLPGSATSAQAREAANEMRRNKVNFQSMFSPPLEDQN